GVTAACGSAAAGAVGVPESELALAATPKTGISAAAPVTIHLTWCDVPFRIHRLTKPKGRQNRMPGTITHQVCHQGPAALDEPPVETGAVSSQPGAPAVGAGRECSVHRAPSQ